ncbi:MAG TPA: hypothetical protein O0X32_01360 [Methanocorpusculum sp.]|nr:hypothetical protein [Methanocorpusculum sp.]
MDKQISRYGFIVKNDVVREIHQALITPEYRDIFENDHSVQEQHPSACYFVRRLPNSKYVCTIHPYRLLICDSYHCCTARINKDGKEVGKIKGRFSLVTKDGELTKIWHENIMASPKDPAHDVIATTLRKHGYSILFYDESDGSDNNL